MGIIGSELGSEIGSGLGSLVGNRFKHKKEGEYIKLLVHIYLLNMEESLSLQKDTKNRL